MAEMIYSVCCMLEEASVSEYEHVLLIKNKKNGTFLHSETISTNWLAVYLKEKGKCLPHTLKQKYRHYFLTSSRPWHALHCLLWILTYLPQDSVQKSFFFFAFCPLYQIQTLFYTFSQCTYLHRLLYIQVHPTRLHLNTSWTTRHLVFSHITSEKRYLVPMCTPKIYIWYNLQKRDHGNSSLDLF